MTDPDRITHLNDAPASTRGRYVLYWMQQSQRVEFNPALEHAIECADALRQPVVVVFGLFEHYPEANERHFAFLVEGLAEVDRKLHERGIRLVVRRASPEAACLELAGGASLVVCDRGYLRHQRAWRKAVARTAGRSVVQVEGDVVVPVDRVSDKREYAARTLRPKINRLLERYLGAVESHRPERSSLRLRLRSDIDARDPRAVLQTLAIDRTVPAVGRFRGGTDRARERLAWFVREALTGYGDARNDPSDPRCSNLSPYLHFGQISPVEMVLAARAARRASDEDRAAFIEELVVRRELAINYAHFEPDYDRYRALPTWARETLSKHRPDAREHRYTRRQLEAAATHDPYWNAAMTEMVRTGYMHNTMRMYWGKKIIEWSASPEHAFRTTLALNNRYFIDGRDASSYTGVGWVYGLHDRPWAERPIFGTVRYMNARGLERKFDIQGYVDWANALPS